MMSWDLVLIPLGLALLVAIGLSEEEWSGPADIIPASLRGWRQIARKLCELLRISAKIAFWSVLTLSAIAGSVIFLGVLPHSVRFGLELAAAWAAFVVVVLPAFSRALDPTELRRRGV